MDGLVFLAPSFERVHQLGQSEFVFLVVERVTCQAGQAKIDFCLLPVAILNKKDDPKVALKKSEIYSSLWSSCDALRGGMDAF